MQDRKMITYIQYIHYPVTITISLLYRADGAAKKVDP